MEKSGKPPLWRTPRQAFFYLMPVGIIGLVHVLVWIFDGFPATLFGWLDMVSSLALTGLLVIRRRYPVSLMVLAIGVSGVYLAIMLSVEPGLPGFGEGDPWLPLAAPVLAYNAVLYARPIGLALVVVLAATAARPWELSPDVLLATVLMVVVPALIGLYIGANRRLVQALTDRAERAEREQHLRAEQARADERLRLAEEMHDVVTHRVSLMVLHAGALGMTAPDESTRTAAEGLRVAGCEALNELRELVGVLRNGDADRDGPQPESAEPAPVPNLETLLAESLSIGVPVELVEEGSPGPTSPTVGRTAYRIVQESLTNIRKHAPGAATVVHVRYIGDRLRLTVRNSPATGVIDPVLSASGSGTGLLGLRQRVELVGGSLHAGPRASGGFEVDAVLPTYVPTTESP